jgi:hypothetical protein
MVMVHGMPAIEIAHDIRIKLKVDEVAAVTRAARTERQPRRLQNGHFESHRRACRRRVPAKSWSQAVKDLMLHSEIRFKDRGFHQLKAVPKRWRPYRIEH